MPPVPPQKEYNYANSLWCTYIVSVVAAWNAELVTYPLDLTKTRLQIQGELANKNDTKLVKAPYRGMFKTALGIVKEEGFMKLWQGAHAALWRHLVYSGTRIVAYKTLKEKLFTKQPNEEYFPVWKSAVCGVTAGAFAQFIASPTDLLKVQLQMEGKRKIMGLPPRVTGLYDAFQKTVKMAGYKGLWKGSIPNVQRAALVNLGDLTTYDSAKRFILRSTTLEDNHFVHCIASCCAGFVAAGMGTPADVVKTRVMNQPLDDKGRGVLYKSSIDCFQKTVKNEGLGALYKGFLPIWMRMAPWSLSFWLSYEEVLSILVWKPLDNPKKSKSIKTIISRRLRILEWLPKYTKTDIISDFIAGLTVGLTMIPQAIAYANLAGLPAQYGLYTAFVGSFTYIFFGTIKEVSIGPTSLMALLTFSYTEDLPVEFVILLTMLCGIVEFLMGILKLGFLVDFISPCVTSGFTSAMSIVIVVSQLKNLLGLRKLKNHGIFDVFRQIFARYNEIQMSDTLLGCSCIIILFLFKFLPKINASPGIKKCLWFLSISKNALMVLITSAIAYYLHEYCEGSPFVLSGDVPSGLPTVQLPQFSTQIGNETVNFIEMLGMLHSSVFVLPVAAVLANVAIAKSFTSEVVDATQEMITLGLCNIFGSFVQAMPSTGAFTRSAVASSSGVRTPLQGLYSGTIIILAISFLTPYFYYIPRTILAAVLIAAIITMFDYEIFPKLWRCNKFDFFLTLITLLTGIFYGVEMGIIIGGLINLLILLKIWTRPQIISEIRRDDHGNDHIYVKPELGLYYPSIDYLTTVITKMNRSYPNIEIVIDCSNIIRIDYAGCLMLETLYKNYGKRLCLIQINPEIFEIFEKVPKLLPLLTKDSVQDVEVNIPLLETVHYGGVNSRKNSNCDV